MSEKRRDDPTQTAAADPPAKEQPDYSAPVRVFLLGDDETPTAALVEKRLRNVRQLYALAFMLRVPEIGGIEVIPVAALLLSTDDNSDLDDYRDSSGVGHGYLLDHGMFKTIDFPGATFTFVGANDPEGDMVGEYNDTAGVGHSFLLSNGAFTSFAPPGATYVMHPGSILAVSSWVST